MTDTKLKSLWILLLEDGQYHLISRGSSDFDEALETARAGDAELLFHGITTAETAEWVCEQWQRSRGFSKVLLEIFKTTTEAIKQDEVDFEEVVRAVRLYVMNAQVKLAERAEPSEMPDADLNEFLRMVETADDE